VRARQQRAEEDRRREAVLAGLVEEHGAALVGFATRLTGDRHAGEDVAQEALLRAWQRVDVLDESKGSIRGWLLTVARNIVTDRARARAVRPAELPETTPHPMPLIDDPAEAVTDSVVVADLLDQLSPDHRAVLLSLYYDGRTVTETAIALGVPPGTVKSRAFYALRLLRARIDRASTA
jgi:RNA polymerase sigma-70 factor (ECF subfamily)